MNTKTMEGLAGAGTNINLLNTPMRVYKEARRRGDLSVMERAADYAGQFASKAHEYQKKAEEGMKEEAEEMKEKARLDQEKAKEAREKENKEYEKMIEHRKEEAEEFQQSIENKQTADTVEISEEGKKMLLGAAGVSHTQAGAVNAPDTVVTKNDSAKEPVVYAYTATGDAGHVVPDAGITISV